MYDTNLVLDAGQTLTNEAQTTAISVEGGVFATFHVDLGVLAADADALRIRLQYSDNNQVSWKTCPGGVCELVDGLDDSKRIVQPVFIPLPDEANAGVAKGDLTPIRIDYELTANATESFAISKAWLEPMISVAPEAAVERGQSEGLYVGLPKGSAAIA